MTEGLITRIGRWIDHRWESKATESMVIERWNSLENAAIKDKLELQAGIRTVSERIDLLRTTEPAEKDITDLRLRLEKIELYCGMTRKVDPTKPAVVKSAFQM